VYTDLALGLSIEDTVLGQCLLLNKAREKEKSGKRRSCEKLIKLNVGLEKKY
jgi:hypothetical protein